MKIRTIIGLALICVFSVASGAQTGQDYFQKALSKERVEGNLREAISLYQKAIEASTDETLAARAQLQIAFCLEKLGLRDAERAFRLVVEKYPGQSEVVKQARERLNRLAVLSAPPAVTPGGISLRKLDVPSGVPSPDGKYIAANENDGDLFLYDVEKMRKTVLKVSSLETGFFQYGVSWSPDSKRFAYVWRSPEHFNKLYIMKVGEAESRLLYDERSAELGNIAGWSPDENWLYVQYRPRANVISKLLGRISVQSGELTRICAVDNSQFNMRLSPDGRYLAFNMDTTPDDHDIRILSADGREQTMLWKHQGWDLFQSWTADGKFIVYSSSNFSQKGLWLLRIENGRPAGTPISVYLSGATVCSVGATNSGVLFIKTELSGTDACTAQIDLVTGETIRPQQPIEPEALGSTSKPFWSPDGKSLAYFCQKRADLATRFHFDTLKVRSMDSGITKQYALDFLADPETAPSPRWSADRRSIYLFGKRADAIGLFQYDLEKRAGEIRLMDGDICACSADGNIVYLDRSAGKKSPGKGRAC
jgi:Tol biopolymer transport system component